MSEPRWLVHLRLRAASVLLGGGWAHIVMRLWLIRDRAMAAVTPEGRVNLAECKALSDALYANLPGSWRLTITREAGQERPPATILPGEKAG